MMVWYVLKLRKRWMSFSAVHRFLGRDQKNQVHYAQYKIDTALVYKVSCFPARSYNAFWKVVLAFQAKVESRKQPTSML